MRNKVMAVAALAGVMSTGCAARIGDFTAMSTRNMKVSGKRSPARVKGESCDRDVLGIAFEHKDMKKAVERALEKAGPNYDALVDVTVDTNWLETIIYGSNCIVVEGTAVATSEG